VATRKGTLYLIPNSLGGGVDAFATEWGKQLVQKIDHFVVEEIKSARRLLRALGMKRDFEEVQFYFLNEHTRSNEMDSLLKPLLAGHDAAIISEAGLPCVADPGSSLVALAHENGIKVVPLSGPSSIFMALMASGLNGQEFTFNGYLPRERSDRMRKIKQLDSLGAKGHTQIFMDVPYRNQQVLEDLLQHCRAESKLCIACNISTQAEMIHTKTIAEWLMLQPSLPKEPTMFLLGK
jgi:16S rRNA (cytidine1402-2'-O)-methyltransferase